MGRERSTMAALRPTMSLMSRLRLPSLLARSPSTLPDPLTPSPADALAGALIREHERHGDSQKQSCTPMITSDCLFVLPFARPRESWQVAAWLAMELADAMLVSPSAAVALVEFLDGGEPRRG